MNRVGMAMEVLLMTAAVSSGLCAILWAITHKGHIKRDLSIIAVAMVLVVALVYFSRVMPQ
jgi:hypothetical protein